MDDRLKQQLDSTWQAGQSASDARACISVPRGDFSDMISDHASLSRLDAACRRLRDNLDKAGEDAAFMACQIHLEVHGYLSPQVHSLLITYLEDLGALYVQLSLG